MVAVLLVWVRSTAQEKKHVSQGSKLRGVVQWNQCRTARESMRWVISCVVEAYTRALPRINFKQVVPGAPRSP